MKFNRTLLLLNLFLIGLPESFIARAQSRQRPEKTSAAESRTQPRLIVGIVVDQMRYDYLFRFAEDYTDGGFRRLVRDGFLFENANYNYVPTYTAPGHACIFTGTTPSVNGIISNDWYDRIRNKSVYCVSDSTVKPVGTSSISGKMSPRRLLTTTITDELRIASNYRSKTIGIALKDRGAILPAGSAANAAYWHDPYSNNWVTSTYYMARLPKWAEEFNARKLADSLLSRPWLLLLAESAYQESTGDDTPYEGLFKGETKPVFPHDLPSIRKADEELIRKTPFGNTFTAEFAKAAIAGERMGQRPATDFLTLSFSSTDYVGHMYGTNAMEVQDTYIRLDRDLSDFFNFLDQTLGKNNYLCFLTADHGAATNPIYNEDHHLPGRDFNSDSLFKALNAYLNREYGQGNYVTHSNAHQVYLDPQVLQDKKIDAAEMRSRCAAFIRNFDGVAEAVTSDEIRDGNSSGGLIGFIRNGYYAERSADVLIELEPGWIDWYTPTGTTHGSAYRYDTHVPLIFMGSGITHGSSGAPVSVTDIAPTIAALLQIESPSGTTGMPLNGLMK